MQHQNWQAAIDDSAYTVGGFVKVSGIPYSTMRGWLLGETTPRQKNLEKMEEAMKKVYGDKKIPWHPSYGYATSPQIEKLNNLGLGPDRDYLMAQIAKQNASGGKTKF